MLGETLDGGAYILQQHWHYNVNIEASSVLVTKIQKFLFPESLAAYLLVECLSIV
jgi:hypothetical protein